ncbi:hypothetical protein N7522_003016 [Penicillium canescens]|nr:hypothetical protein N7522_003016 [Penicillium canescens]
MRKLASPRISSLALLKSAVTEQSLASFSRKQLAQSPNRLLNEHWLPNASAFLLPTTYFPQTSAHRDLAREANPPRNDRKPPDERTLKLGKTLRTLSPLLPTILYSNLPASILAPNVNLRLFPSTHPHLPNVKGRALYRAALWTLPVAWGSVPLVGNVRLQIISERIVRAGDLTSHGDHVDSRDERLIVRWKTEPRTDRCTFQRLNSSSNPVYATTSRSTSPPQDTAWTKVTNKGLNVLVGGNGPIFKLAKEEQFTGLFIFSFDEEGHILTHTIDNAEGATCWDRTSKFVTLTDWLIKKAYG